MAKQRPKKTKGKIVPQPSGSAAISLDHAAEVNRAEGINGPVITIKFKHLATAAYLYMVVPILIFFVSWLRWYIGFPMAAILAYGLYFLLKTDYFNNNSILILPIRHIILIAFVLLTWVWLSGQGGLFYQTSDNHWRNAIFRDLINYSWPVIYPKTGDALVYYLMHWIVPALFGKMFGWLGGNIALALWTYLGIMISYLLIVKCCNANVVYKLWLVALVFILWGGLHQLGLSMMDILGYNYYSLGSGDGWLDFGPMVNGYGYGYQYSMNNTLLCWVYNQTIVPWIAVPLFLLNRKIGLFTFIGLCVLPFAPLPFCGLFIIMLGLAVPEIYNDCKSKNYKMLAKKIFSIPNVSAFCTIFVVFLLYFKTNMAASGNDNKGGIGLYVPLSGFNIKRIILLIIFCLIEFGFYAIIIEKFHKKDLLYYLAIISLIIIPNFRIGSGRDFCMRASIPALFILMIMVLQYLCQGKKTLFIDFTRTVALIIALTLSGLNVFSDYAGKLNLIHDSPQFPIVADDIKTFSDKTIGGKVPWMENFLVPDPETKAFYKYLARK